MQSTCCVCNRWNIIRIQDTILWGDQTFFRCKSEPFKAIYNVQERNFQRSLTWGYLQCSWPLLHSETLCGTLLCLSDLCSLHHYPSGIVMHPFQLSWRNIQLKIHKQQNKRPETRQEEFHGVVLAWRLGTVQTPCCKPTSLNSEGIFA